MSDFFARDARTPGAANGWRVDGWRRLRIPRESGACQDGHSMRRRCELRYGEDAVRWPTPQSHARYWIAFVREDAFAAYQARVARRTQEVASRG